MNSQIDRAGIKLGMWLFLYSEIILFGGLFVLYAAYLHRYPEFFAEGGKELNRIIGAINTIVLLISSFTVAASITAIQRNAKKQAVGFLLFSIFCGVVFLVNIFFGLYYVITGLHGLHVIIGMVLLSVSLIFVLSGKVTASRFSMLDNSGLYWHLVDLIWIFVFPLFYLVL